MKVRVSHVLSFLWLACSIGLLLLTLYIYDGTPATRDAELVLLYGMMVLCFPIGQLAMVVFWLFAVMAEGATRKLAIPTSHLTLVIEWLILFVAGCLQWFVLLPSMWSKWQAKLANRRRNTA